MRGREGFYITRLLNGLINLARTLVAGTIYTSPDMDILKELRKKAWIVAEPTALYGVSKHERLAKLYQKRMAPGRYTCMSSAMTRTGWTRYPRTSGKSTRRRGAEQ